MHFHCAAYFPCVIEIPLTGGTWGIAAVFWRKKQVLGQDSATKTGSFAKHQVIRCIFGHFRVKKLSLLLYNSGFAYL